MTKKSCLTEEARALIAQINAHLNHRRVRPSGAKYLRRNPKTGQNEWHEDAGEIRQSHSMFPYKSTAMCVERHEVAKVKEYLRKRGLLTEFDEEGRPIIESAKQQDALAKAFGMKTGRDGYGHIGAHGEFQNSGRRRADEIQEGKRRMKKLIDGLEAMPDETPPEVTQALFEEYDIRPTEENTG